MKVRVQINRLCNVRDMNPYKLAKETGLSHSLLWKLRHGKTKGIKFEVLEKICDVLKCEPNDVLVSSRAKRRTSKKG